MITDSSIQEIISEYPSLGLSQLSMVSLMNRSDCKYVFPAGQLPALLTAMKGKYYILEINGKRQSPYSSLYFDSPDFSMFTAHHAKALNRYKLRHRSYQLSEQSFLEVKIKNNKGKTIKKRIPLREEQIGEQNFIDFISAETPFDPQKVQAVLKTSFNRMTFVDASYSERVTIDTHLTYQGNSKEYSLSGIAIAEIKNERKYRNSAFSELAHDLKIRPQSFSKYITGCMLIKPELKSNRFKQRFLKIIKMNNGLSK